MLQHLKDSDNNDDDKNYLHRRMYTVWREKNGLIKENLSVLAMYNGKPSQNHCQGRRWLIANLNCKIS